MINVDELQDRRTECRIELHRFLEILPRLIAASELRQHLRVAVVESALIGIALEHLRDDALRFRRASGLHQHIRDREPAREIVGIQLPRGAQMFERLIDFGAVVAGALEQHASEDSLRVVQIRRCRRHFAQLFLRLVETTSIDQHDGALIQKHAVRRIFFDDFVDARERFIEAAFRRRQFGDQKFVRFVGGDFLRHRDSREHRGDGCNQQTLHHFHRSTRLRRLFDAPEHTTVTVGGAHFMPSRCTAILC